MDFIKVGELCVWQELGEIHQEVFKLAPQGVGDGQLKGFSEGETVETQVGRPSQMGLKVWGFRCRCNYAQSFGNKKEELELLMQERDII